MTDTTPQAKPLAIAFTGSGSEYFRIWIVNLLLTLVTIGLYHPWAKVRRLRYFYGNTHVGDHALDFHGDPKRMLRGFLLVGAMFVLYAVAGRVSPTAGLIAFVIVALVWPALFRAAQRFRMANTSWRGLRFRFTGNVADAYLAMLPLFIPAALFLVSALIVSGNPGTPPARAAVASLALTAATLALMPLLGWLLKRYQHGHYALGDMQTRFRARVGSFYLLALQTFGLGIGVGLGGGLLAAVGGFGGGLFNGEGASHKAPVVAIFVLLVLTYIAILVLAVPFVTARLQNLVWNRTESPALSFASALRFRSLLRVTVKNWLMMIVTLGLYWPFAAVALARLRLEAVTVLAHGDPDEIVSAVRERGDDATGDAAGDLFGIDIGL